MNHCLKLARSAKFSGVAVLKGIDFTLCAGVHA